MEKSTKELAQQANASVGYNANNPEPAEMKDPTAAKDLDMNALYSAMGRISEKT